MAIHQLTSRYVGPQTLQIHIIELYIVYVLPGHIVFMTCALRAAHCGGALKKHEKLLRFGR